MANKQLSYNSYFGSTSDTLTDLTYLRIRYYWKNTLLPTTLPYPDFLDIAAGTGFQVAFISWAKINQDVYYYIQGTNDPGIPGQPNPVFAPPPYLEKTIIWDGLQPFDYQANIQIPDDGIGTSGFFTFEYMKAK